MVLLIITILLILGGVAFQIFGDYDTIGNWICFMLGGMILIIFILIIISVPINGVTEIERYNEAVMYLEEIKDVIYFSKEERTVSVSYVNKINKKIRENRVLRNNFWVGWFYYDDFGDLELLSYKTVIEHNNRITVEGL
jgi:hypothetical protein